MADLNYRVENASVVAQLNWGAIWAGTFTFVAIWSVFGMLGLNLFATSPNANPSEPIAGMNVGTAVWGPILTMIAMFVAGRVTGQLAAIHNSRDGIIHGMVMFGMSVAGAVVLAVIGGNAFGSTFIDRIAHSVYILTIFSDLGWVLFVSLLLGWLAAMAGASTSHKEFAQRAIHGRVRHA
jgi:hypothetical protein